MDNKSNPFTCLILVYLYSFMIDPLMFEKRMFRFEKENNIVYRCTLSYLKKMYIDFESI